MAPDMYAHRSYAHRHSSNFQCGCSLSFLNKTLHLNRGEQMLPFILLLIFNPLHNWGDLYSSVLRGVREQKGWQQEHAAHFFLFIEYIRQPFHFLSFLSVSSCARPRPLLRVCAQTRSTYVTQSRGRTCMWSSHGCTTRCHHACPGPHCGASANIKQ